VPLRTSRLETVPHPETDTERREKNEKGCRISDGKTWRVREKRLHIDILLQGRSNRKPLGSIRHGCRRSSCISCLLDVFLEDATFAQLWASKEQETIQWRKQSQSSLRRLLWRCLRVSGKSWMNTTIAVRGLSRRRATLPRPVRRCNKIKTSVCE
jgi:hypothetical protein